MRTGRCTAFARAIAFLAYACIFVAASPAAAENTGLKDPYNGGTALPPGGGEPGKAYMAFIDAAYKKDHAAVCKLITEPAGVPLCLQEKQAIDTYMAMFTYPKSHKVLGGYIKDNDATLNVAYEWNAAPESKGFVTMRQENGRWSIASFGGSASVNIKAEASGKVDFTTGEGEASAHVTQSAGNKYTGLRLGKWTFEGKDSKGVVWTGTLTISEQDLGNGLKYVDCSLDVKNPSGGGSGVGSECTGDPAKREIQFGPDPGALYRAVLSADGKKMTGGKWTEADKDWTTGKVTVKLTGDWSAAYAPGQADPGSASLPVDSGAPAAPEFAVIEITPNTREYSGRCPAAIAFTANISFKMPVPEQFTYHWEISDGRKLPERTVKPPRNGHMSLREVWRGGKKGEEHEASVRFTAAAGNSSMVLDPPAVKVICK
ncbi:MAG TPA: hypothetical protein VK654_14085 [Nitrospirota bacterium]|nr:hypothetical protein [Nitrospirota bacterium]